MRKKLHFKVSSRTARLIGRENVSSAESALIELVKNSYDADAEHCIIYFDQKGQLYIIDDGHGMTADVIEDCWMTIGTNNKETEYVSSDLGRIKTGEKGIGRFALDRLGQSCTMHTKHKASNDSLIWKADWKDFENEKFETVDEIEADLETTDFNLKDIVGNVLSRSATQANVALRLLPFVQGTVINVDNLSDVWNKQDLKRLFQSLSTLIPPKEESAFEVHLYSDAHPDDFGKIEASPCDDYDYKVTARITKKNNAKIVITRNEYDLNRIDADLFKREAMKKFPFDKATFSQKTFQYERTLGQLLPGFNSVEDATLQDLGGFTFTFYFMKKAVRSQDKEKFFHKDVNAKLRNGWLEEHAGIKIFRDNFRVRPYGEPNSSSMDWLGLGPRYASNPAGVARRGQYKIREHNLSGVVNISRVTNPALKDLSSRTGLQEGRAFDLFKQVLISIVGEFEYDRSYIASEMDALYKSKSSKKEREKQAGEIKKKSANKRKDENKSEADKEIELLIQHAEDLKEERIELLNEQKILRVLASSGAMLATFGHEVHAMQNVINDRAATLRFLIEPYLDYAESDSIPSAFNPYSYIDQTEKLDNKLLHWMKFALSGIRKDKRNRKNISLDKYFDNLQSLWSAFLSDRKILLTVSSKSEGIIFKGFEAELDALFNNLIVNSVEIFTGKTVFNNRDIRIETDMVGSSICISYRDTGTGLSKDIDDPTKIFDLYYSTKRDPNTGKSVGTGIGMYLVKSIVDDYGGTMSIVNVKQGFALDIRLPTV
jgi:signal transduction histidine kinase